jgi:protoporphyrinogen oxidase
MNKMDVMKSNADVLIIGAGLAGLCCARRLHQEGIPFTLFEASDSVGGRVKTDIVNGFLLDRGFQIFLTAYPEAQSVLNYRLLDFKPFMPGALVRCHGEFHELSDPIRRPSKLLETMLSPIGSVADKLRMGLLRQGVSSKGLFSQNSATTTTLQTLKHLGFSEEMIAQFFHPFLSGIFLEKDLATSSLMFEFVFKMLAAGDNVLPARGMHSIPQQIADSLPSARIKLAHAVTKVEATTLTLSSGQSVQGSAIVIATEEPQARRLLGQEPLATHRSQTCLYYSADKAPIDKPILVLNGDLEGMVNNFCVPSNVSRSYAPDGKALLSASVIGDPDLPDSDLQAAVSQQLTEWFGHQVKDWEHLRTYRIRYALPDQTPQAVAAMNHSYKADCPIYSCGDYKETGSINGAMLSGRKAAEAVIADMARTAYVN